MKKVGVVNFHFADNFGAVLQCYALQEILQNISKYRIEIIDYRPINIEKDYAILPNPFADKRINTITSLKILINNLRPTKLIKKIKKKSLFNSFRKQYLNLSDYKFNEITKSSIIENSYDYYITGSDQVWNPSILGKIDDIYFLTFNNNRAKKISYAASTGSAIIENEYLNSFISAIEDFQSISIREESSAEFLSKFTEKPINVTLDPTLLLKKEDWNRVSTNGKLAKKYILVYDLQLTETMKEIVNFISEKLNLNVVSYQGSSNYRKGNKSFQFEGPREFLNLYKNAEFVITSSFHGTVFSIIFEKKFITVPHTKVGDRMVDLLKKLGLNERIIYSSNQVTDQIINSEIDYTLPNQILENERKKSIIFLKSALDL